MGTRATYEIEGKTFYIHWDGYPAGAAHYFTNMLLDKGKGGLAACFIRGNEMAEFTKSHESHGDTDFKYTVSKDGEGVIHVAYSERAADGSKWKPSKKMTLSAFILPYVKESIGGMHVEACTPRGTPVSRVQENVDAWLRNVGAAVVHGGWIPTYESIKDDYEWTMARRDSLPVRNRLVCLPTIQPARLEVTKEILESREFREHVALRGEG